MYQRYALTIALLFAATFFGGVSPQRAVAKDPTPGCTFSITPISVNYNVYTSTATVQTVVWTYSCSNLSAGTTASIQLSDGGNSGTFYMSDGNGHRLAYSLCGDMSCNTNYGVSNLQVTLSNGTGQITLLAVLSPNQSVYVGSYGDNLQASILY